MFSCKKCSRVARYDEGTWCGIHRPKSECSICLEAIPHEEVRRTLCGHSFHKVCLSKWFREGAANTCPMCRHELFTVAVFQVEV